MPWEPALGLRHVMPTAMSHRLVPLRDNPAIPYWDRRCRATRRPRSCGCTNHMLSGSGSKAGKNSVCLLRKYWYAGDHRAQAVLALAQCLVARLQHHDDIVPSSVVGNQPLSVRPPSTMISEPTVHRDSSEARYSTALATSSGVPKRPNGMVAVMSLLTCSR